MTTLTLGPVIGKIGGGAEVQKIPVVIEASGARGSVATGNTVEVPAGEFWLIAVQGELTTGSFTNQPRVRLGDASEITVYENGGIVALVTEVKGPATIPVSIQRGTPTNTDRFSGHVYVAPLPD